jgi:hypothetical protein
MGESTHGHDEHIDYLKTVIYIQGFLKLELAPFWPSMKRFLSSSTNKPCVFYYGWSVALVQNERVAKTEAMYNATQSP